MGDLTGSSGLTKALAGVTLAGAGLAIGIGVKAVEAASAFQNAMLQNSAHAGLAASQINAVSDAVKAMSIDVGQMPTDLAQALYPILSGFSGITDQAAKAQTSLEALRLSAEDVTGTETKTTTASSALVNTFNALGLQTNDTATNISRLKTLNDQMEATIIAGNMHWQDYANVAGKLGTAIKGTSVQWTEASAALATMTNEGFSAQRSQTYLANLFTQLDLKTASMVKNAKKLGIAFDENKFKSLSLSGQLDYLTQITGGNNSEVLKLLNSNATALKTYNALSTSMKAYQSNLDAIKNSHGATASAFAIASSGFQAAGQRMRAAINVLLIDLGEQLLPVLTKVLNWVTPLIKQFALWVTTSRDVHQWVANLGNLIQFTFLPMIVNTWNAVSNLVRWLQQSSPPAQTLKYILAAIVTMNVAKSIGDMASNLATMGKNAVDAGLKMLQYFSPNSSLAAGIDAVNAKIGNVGASALTSAADVTGASATEEADLAAVGGTATTTATEMLGIGSAAEADAGEMTAAGATIGGVFATIGGWIADIGGMLGGLIPMFGGLALAFSTVPDTLKAAYDPGHGHWQTIGGKGKGSTRVWVLDPTSATKATGGIPTSGWPYGTYYPEPKPSGPTTTMKHFASGGLVTETGPIYAHAGEYVLRAGQGGGITIQNLVINNPMRNRNDIERLADELDEVFARRFRSQTGNYASGGTF